MPEPYNRQQVLDSLRTNIPSLDKYSDDVLIQAYNKKRGLTKTGLPSLEKQEATEPPKYKPLHAPKETGYGERFAKRAWEAFVPLGMYEPEMEEAEGFGEQFAGALGSGAGFVLGAWPFALLTGGLSVPVKAAQAATRVGKLIQRARKAEEAGKKGYRTSKEIQDWLWKSYGDKSAKNYISKEALTWSESGMGLLGKNELYRRGLESMVNKGQVKLAKALDMGIKNLATFSLYGQTHMKPNSPLEQRWESLKADAVTAGLFTGLGTLSTRVMFSNLTGKAEAGAVLGETMAMFGAGAYMSDLGQQDIPYEERMAHGMTLALMHLAGVGMDKAKRKEAMVEVLIGQGHSIADAKRMVYKSRVVEDLDNAAITFAKNSPTLFVDERYSGKKKPSHLGSEAKKPELGEYLTHFVELVKEPKDGSAPYVLIEHFKPKNLKGKEDKILLEGDPRQEKIIGKEVKGAKDEVLYTAAEDALQKFQRRFKSFSEVFPEEVPKEPREKIPKGVTQEAKDEISFIKDTIKELKRFVSTAEKPVERSYEVENVPLTKTTGDVIPKVDTRLTEKELIEKKIKTLEKTIENKKWVIENQDKLHLTGRLLFSEETPWHLMSSEDILAMSVRHALSRSPAVPQPFIGDKWNSKMRSHESKLKELKDKLKIADNKVKKHSIVEDYQAGDWVRIPLYVGDGKFSKSEAGLGRYEGKYGELTGGKYPTIGKEEINTRGLDAYTEKSNLDVFAVVTPEGIERLEYIAVRPNNSRPEMRHELEPHVMKSRHEQNIRIKELDATQASPSTPEISMLDVFESNYKFSLPSNIKTSKDLPKGAHHNQRTLVKRLDNAGITPEEFIKTLKKDGSITISSRNKSYTYRYAGEKEVKPDFENVIVENIHPREHYTVDSRVARAQHISEGKSGAPPKLELKPEFADPSTKVWTFNFPDDHLPFEYMRDNRFISASNRKEILDGIIAGKEFKISGDRITIRIEDPAGRGEHSIVDHVLPGQMISDKGKRTYTSFANKKTPVSLSSSQIKAGESAVSAKLVKTEPYFKSEAEVRNFINKLSKSKFDKYEEFYLVPAEINQNKPVLVSERKGFLEAAKQDLKESLEEGGDIRKAAIKEQEYLSGQISKNETGSMINLNPEIGYNTKLAARLSDILNIDFGKPKKLRLTKLDKRGNKLPESRDFKRGDVFKSDFSLGFDTNREAVNFARKWWIGEKTEAELSSMLKQEEVRLKDYGKSTEYKDYTKAQRKTARVLSKAGIPINMQGYKGGGLLGEVLDTFFPQAKRDFNNLNTTELNRLSAMFRRNQNTEFIPEQVDILPPDNIYFKGPASQRIMKLVQRFNPALPVYTVIDTAGSWAKKIATRMMVKSSIERSLKGAAQDFSSLWFKFGRLKEKDLQTLHIEIEPKFEAAREGTKHKKEVERLKKETVKVKVPRIETRKDPKTGKIKEEIIREYEPMSKYDYGVRLIRDFYDKFAIAQAHHGVEVYNAKTKKKNPYLQVSDDKGNVIKNKSIVAEDLIKLLKREKGKGKLIRVVQGNEFAKVKIGKVDYNYYKSNFFHRVLTEPFWDLVISEKADGYLLKKIIANDPNLRRGYIETKEGRLKRGSPDEVYAEAKKYLDTVRKYSNDSSKIVDGQIFTRVAKIDPVIYYGKNGILIEEPAKFYKKDGSKFEKGDVIEHSNGKKDVVTDVVQTYSTDSIDIINKYTSKAAKSASTYGAYGKPDIIQKTATGKAIETGSEVVYEIERMKLDIEKSIPDKAQAKKNIEFYENLIHRVLKDHIYGRDYNHPYLGEYLGPKVENLIGKITRGSAVVGLSFPISGIKNLVLGQRELAAISGRQLLKTYYQLLTSGTARREAYALAKEVGAVYSGVYDLFIKPATPLSLIHSRHKGLKGVAGTGVELSKEALLFTGGMRPTEMFNRVIASTMGTRMLDIHLDNMIGRKSIMNKGIPKSYSRSILENVLRFTPKEMDLMLKKRKAGGNGYTDTQRLWAADRAHTVTQGVGDLPYVPYWMGNKGWKPFTLFYRIAYRMTDNVANNVVMPAVNHGNIWPMMKYVGMSVAAGEGLYSLYWYAFGEDRKNRLKEAPAQYWSNFVRAEGLGVMSNAFDEYGNSVSDAYYPVVLRNMSTLTKEFMHFASGEKRFAESVESGLKKTVALYNGSQRIIQNITKATTKRVTDSKRRQAQFLDVFFPKYNPSRDAGDYLTQNSPYYQSIRDAFWTDEVKLKSDTYEVALNYLTDVIIRDNSSLAKNPIQARKQAKARIKNIISRMQPIPASWRERKKGDRYIKYNLYMSKLTPKQVKEEKELEKLFKVKKREFWNAARR